MKRYNPNDIEARWQEDWQQNQVFKVEDDDPKPKFYQLVEFPYPSGAGLHVGHCRPYINFDIMSRWRRMGGENVLFPMGWDAFGLPAEQYALKTGVNPAITTKDAIKTFRNQINRLGLSFDWSREYSTADPEAYQWTQWIFLNMFKAGLAYQAESMVWWCEGLKSVLADEEVINGKSERGDFPCERRPLRQWMLAITKYADRLYDDLDDVDYIEPVKVSQRNWIGRSRGAEVSFKVAEANENITIFTTRADTLFGATYLVLAPEHALVSKITSVEQKAVVEDYVKQTSHKSDLSRQEDVNNKTGAFTGAFAVNPINNQKIPIWISDYVLMSYGTGAIMAVPAHDERDWQFAKQFELPIVRVVQTDEPDDVCTHAEGKMINSGSYNGMESFEAREKITRDLEAAGNGQEKVNYKLRDWVFSRQRYWGEPFPIVWVDHEAYQKVGSNVKQWLPQFPVTKPDGNKTKYALPIVPEYLPVVLPEVDDFRPGGLGKGPLVRATHWSNITFNLQTGETKSSTKQKAGGDWVEAVRETDIMPNWAGSSWYFLRYLDPHNHDAIADPAKIKAWMPVNWYNGGMEHTTLHLLYSRFWHKFLYDIKVVDTKEPYEKRTSHGLILAEDGRKMSKSWGNVIDPMEVAKDYGADSLRLYMAFIGPFDQPLAWSTSGLAGSRRFIERLWAITQSFIDEQLVGNGAKNNNDLKRIIATANKRISTDLPKMHFNTAVAALMEAVNGLYKIRETLSFSDNPAAWREALNELVIIAAPFIPHICEELWHSLGREDSVTAQQWPLWDEDALLSHTKNIVVQVNGKLRTSLNVANELEEQELVDLAKRDDKVAKQLEGKTVGKVIYVKDKLINFVV